MDQVKGGEPKENLIDSDLPLAVPLAAIVSHQEQAKPKVGYWTQLIKEKPDRHIELFLTLVIGFFAAVQLVVSCRNNDSTTLQTDQLIAAAKINAYAAQKNAQAASDFSNSARSINSGIDDAVDRLQRQAIASQQIAAATIAASDSTIKAARVSNKPYLYPIVSSTGSIGDCVDQNRTGNYHLHANDKCGHFSYKNFGQTPAFDVRISGFIRSAANGKAIPDHFPTCKGFTQEMALGKDATDGCEMVALSGEDNEIRNLLMTRSMPGQAYFMRGYIEFDDIYKQHTKEPFCIFYPLTFDVNNLPRNCQPNEAWFENKTRQ